MPVITRSQTRNMLKNAQPAEVLTQVKSESKTTVQHTFQYWFVKTIKAGLAEIDVNIAKMQQYKLLNNMSHVRTTYFDNIRQVTEVMFTVNNYLYAPEISENFSTKLAKKLYVKVQQLFHEKCFSSIQPETPDEHKTVSALINTLQEVEKNTIEPLLMSVHNSIDNDTWKMLAETPAGIHLIEEKLKQNPNSCIDYWHLLASNPVAIQLIERELEQKNPTSYILSWSYLCLNPAAIHLIERELEQYPNSYKIYWQYLNKNPAAIHLIERELEKNRNSSKISWGNLCLNPAAIHLIERVLEKNPESKKICWRTLNKNPAAIHLIEKELTRDPNSDNIYWDNLCSNPGAFRLIEKELEQNPNSTKINWQRLYSNPGAINLLQKLKKTDDNCWYNYTKNNNNRIDWYNRYIAGNSICYYQIELPVQVY